MGTWKFLVQREGKRSWTVLEGETMSLEPGRYRIAARAPLANTPIAIEIAVVEASGERRTYRRSTRTNDDGLLAVIPFTELSDGAWTLTCQAIGDRLGGETASMSWRVVEEPKAPKAALLTEVEAPESAEPEEVAAADVSEVADAPSELEAVSEEALEEMSEPISEFEAVEETDESMAEEAEASDAALIDEGLAISEDLEEETEVSEQDRIEAADRIEAVVLGEEAIESVVSEAAIEPEEDLGEASDVAESAEAIAQVPTKTDLENDEIADEAADEVEQSEADDLGSDAIETETTEAKADLENDEIAEPQNIDASADEPVEAAETDATVSDEAAPKPIAIPAQIALPDVDVRVEIAAENEPEIIAEVAEDVSERDPEVAATAAEAEPTEPEEPAENPAKEPEIDRSDRLVSFAAPETPAPVAPPKPDATVPDVAVIDTPPIRTQYDLETLALQLDRTSFAIEPGGTLTLSGCVRADESISPDTRLGGLHLRLRLREPQSLQLLVVKQYLLPPTAGGEIPFERSLPLPKVDSSKLILGELLLCDTVPNTVAKQSFTITSGLESLLNNLSDRQQREPAVWQTDRWSDADRTADRPPRTTPPLLPNEPKPKLDLPGFVASADSGIDKSQLLASLGLAPEAADSPRDSGEFTDIPSTADKFTADATDESSNGAGRSSLEAASNALAESRRVATKSGSPFEPLTPPSHRNDRFVSRLNQFARDEEIAGWLDADGLELGTDTEPDLASGDLAPLSRTGEVLASDPNDSERDSAREIVLDRPNSQSSRFVRQPTPTPSARPVLPENTSIPSPDLRVPPGQLTAGRSILVRARLPELNSRIYVKLWIFDRQNQALLDGPRWLTDFLPLDDGTVEGMVNLTVPYGGLDVQFEAIAVEVETDRESYKAAVERRIIPAAPPTLPLENRHL